MVVRWSLPYRKTVLGSIPGSSLGDFVQVPCQTKARRMEELSKPCRGKVCLVVSVSGSTEGGGVDGSECGLIKDAEP